MSEPATKRPKMDAESGSASGSRTQRRSTPPKIIFNESEERFAPIVNTAGFVDKTLFIKAFIKAPQSEIVVLAPRRFGKSTNMDMIREFVSGNDKLFRENKLKIYEDERDFFDKNCKKHPVISLNFKTVCGQTKDAVLQNLKRVVGRAYSANKHLVKKDLKGNWAWADEKLEGHGITAEKFIEYCANPTNLTETDVIFGLKILSECLEVHHDEPVYVFIDEFDAPVMNAIMETNSDKAELDETINPLRAVISDFLKGNNKCVKKALITGCVRVAETLSAYANNIVYYDFLKEVDFAPYFGFTDKEVETLFEKEEFASYKNDEIQKWYNGYRFMHKKKEYVIYNSYSILNYLLESREMKKPTFDKYWVNSGSITILDKLFAKTEIKNKIAKLIDGEKVEIDVVDKIDKQNIVDLKALIHEKSDAINADLFLQFLSQNGYLHLTNLTISNVNRRATVTVPNEELKRVLEKACYNSEFFQTKYKFNDEQREAYEDALYILLEQRDKDKFINFANTVFKLFSKEKPRNEDELHSVLYTLTYNLKDCEGRSEMHTQRLKQLGVPPHLDMLVVLGNAGIIFKFKHIDKTSVLAYEQIKTQKYDTAFTDVYESVTKKTLIGLHMAEDGKVSLTWSFDDNKETYTVTSNL